jgi:hypothetical protein
MIVRPLIVFGYESKKYLDFVVPNSSKFKGEKL